MISRVAEIIWLTWIYCLFLQIYRLVQNRHLWLEEPRSDS